MALAPTTRGITRGSGRQGSRRVLITQERQSVWTQVDSNELFKDPKPGMPVRIRQASLGSFLVVVDNMRAFRARRME